MPVEQGVAPFLAPRSVAVIGASATPGRVGYVIVENLLSSPAGVRVFPVNPRGGEVMGRKIYPSLGEIPEEIDLAIIAIAPAAIPEAVAECVRCRVKAAIISSAGFAEGGAEGKRLQQRVVDTARQGGVRLMGPNTQGVINLEIGLPLLSTPFPPSLTRPGPVSFICQSALFPLQFLLGYPYIGLNKMIDLGNMCDVDHAEALAYLGEDPGTKVVALHIEGVGEGRRLVEVASRVARSKPVVALKAGRTPGGMRAVASHSGSLAGNDEVSAAAFRQAGVFRARDMDDLNDYLLALTCLPPVRGKRVAILTTTGAGGALAADACAEFGLELASLSPATIAQIRQEQPEWVTIGNPADVWQVLEVSRLISDFTAALNALAADPGVDALAVVTHLLPDSPYDTLEPLREYARRLPKPAAVWAVGTPERHQELAWLGPLGLPAFPSIARTVRALAISHAFYHRHQGAGAKQ